MMALKITTDGKIIDMGCRPTLEQLQDAVGGYIEYVPLNDQTIAITGHTHMYCNEMGKLEGLPFNAMATSMMRNSHDVIVGNAVLMTDDDDGSGEEE